MIDYSVRPPARVGALVALMVTALAVILFWSAAGGGQSASAGITASVSLDAVSDGANTATSVGTIDSCRALASGETAVLDLVIQDVSGLAGFEVDLVYDPAVLRVVTLTADIEVDYEFLLASTSTAVLELGDALPDDDWSGTFKLAAAQFPASPASGSGVLARFRIEAVGSGPTDIALTNVKLSDGTGTPIPPSDTSNVYQGPINGATIAVDGACTDSDGDGVVDGLDNCPDDLNSSQADLDGDGIGDDCDGDIDGDHFWNQHETDMGSNPTDASSMPEVCDGLDNDGDSSIDEGYDLNTNGVPDCTDLAADTDGDGTANPTDLDDDGDRWDDTVEVFTGMNSLIPCPAGTGSELYAWVPDTDNSGLMGITDVLRFTPHFLAKDGGSSDSRYNRRFDYDGDGLITLLDVLRVTPDFNTFC